MPITDLRAFSDKYYGRSGSGFKPEDIAKTENITIPEVREALSFLVNNIQITWAIKTEMWKQLQYSKTHPYVPPPSPPGAVPNAFGPPAGQKTIANIPETEYWDKMKSLVQQLLKEAMGAK